MCVEWLVLFACGSVHTLILNGKYFIDVDKRSVFMSGCFSFPFVCLVSCAMEFARSVILKNSVVYSGWINNAQKT
jgi:hypothetical protein